MLVLSHGNELNYLMRKSLLRESLYLGVCLHEVIEDLMKEEDREKAQEVQKNTSLFAIMDLFYHPLTLVEQVSLLELFIFFLLFSLSPSESKMINVHSEATYDILNLLSDLN